MASTSSEPAAHPMEPRWGSEDRPRKAEAIWQTLQHFCGPDISQGAWLDIGCGSGGIAATLAPRVRLMTGLDPEPWTRWATWMDANPNLKFLQGSYDSSPARVQPESIDVVICNQVYEHVPDPVALITFIHRSLKPGGVCYFAGPNLLFPVEPHVFWPFVHWLPRKFALGLMRALGSKRVDNLDANSVHYWKLKKWLTHGFKVQNGVPVIIRAILAERDLVRLSIFIQHLPLWLIDFLTPFSPGFAFVLEKHESSY